MLTKSRAPRSLTAAPELDLHAHLPHRLFTCYRIFSRTPHIHHPSSIKYETQRLSPLNPMCSTAPGLLLYLVAHTRVFNITTRVISIQLHLDYRAPDLNRAKSILSPPSDACKDCRRLLLRRHRPLLHDHHYHSLHSLFKLPKPSSWFL